MFAVVVAVDRCRPISNSSPTPRIRGSVHPCSLSTRNVAPRAVPGCPRRNRSPMVESRSNVGDRSNVGNRSNVGDTPFRTRGCRPPSLPSRIALAGVPSVGSSCEPRRPRTESRQEIHGSGTPDHLRLTVEAPGMVPDHTRGRVALLESPGRFHSPGSGPHAGACSTRAQRSLEFALAIRMVVSSSTNRPRSTGA